jgi:hypothetical protein
MARGGEPDRGRATYEEMMVQGVQRLLRAAERPIIGGVDWDALRSDALTLLDGLR